MITAAMTEFKLIFKFVDRDFLFRLIFIALLYSVVPIAEVMLFFELGQIVGPYLVLIIAAVVGLFGVLLAMRQMRVTLGRLKSRISAGEYPGREFVDLMGIAIGSILLLTPGFITDLVGFLLLISPIRQALGRLTAGKMGAKFREIYDYLRLRELR
jgi:UPF0716 protein FxsA